MQSRFNITPSARQPWANVRVVYQYIIPNVVALHKVKVAL